MYRIGILLTSIVYMTLVNLAQASLPTLTQSRLSNLLEQPSVSAIHRDRTGVLWIGTQQGLHRYDGSELQVFGSDKLRQSWIPESEIRDILEDKFGNLLVASSGGVLLKWNKQTFGFDPVNWPDTASDSKFVRMRASSNGTTWLLYRDGLQYYDPKLDRLHKWQADVHAVAHIGVPRAIAEDGAGNLWIGGSHGINKIELETGKLEHIGNQSLGLPVTSSITALEIGKDHHLIVGTNNGELAVWDSILSRILSVSTVGVKEQIYISQVLRLEDTLLIGTDRGLYLSDIYFSYYEEIGGADDSSSHPDVYSLYLDDKYIWVGEVDGLELLTFSPFEHFNADNSGVSNYVLGFAEDENGLVWIGTYSGLYYYDDRSETHIRQEVDSNIDTAIDRRIVSLAASENGLWLGHFEAGLELYSADKSTSVVYNSKLLKQMSVTRIIASKVKPDIWVATYDHGLFRITEQGTHSYLQSETLRERSITLIFQPQDNSLFAVSEKRLYQYIPDSDQFDEIPLNFGLEKKRPSIYSMSESKSNDILIGTKDHGLFIWSRKNQNSGRFILQQTNAEGDLATATIYGIEPDQAGNLWCSTQNGIVKLDPQGQLIKRFTIADGLQGKDFSFGASFQSSEGIIYFGGTNGYNRFDPNSIDVENESSPMRLTGISLPGRKSSEIGDVNELRSLYLTHNEQSVTFQFSVLDFIDAERNQFRYKLENFDSEWVENGTNNTASFTNLPTGNYTFRVQGANSAGIWNREGLSLSVTVLPPPWLTWWAYILYSGTLLVLIWALHRIYHSYVVERKSAEMALEMFDAENRADDDMQEQLEMQDDWVSSAYQHSRTTLSLINQSISLSRFRQAESEHKNTSQDCINRVAAFSRLEDCMTYHASGPCANLHEYAEGLLQDLLPSSPVASETVVTINEVTSHPIDAELASPIAVIAYELLNNCFQHAFNPESPANYIHIALTHAVTAAAPYRLLQLTVRDNGIGMNLDIENLDDDSHGLAIVKSAAETLGATVEVSTDSGTTISINIPEL